MQVWDGELVQSGGVAAVGPGATEASANRRTSTQASQSMHLPAQRMPMHTREPLDRFRCGKPCHPHATPMLPLCGPPCDPYAAHHAAPMRPTMHPPCGPPAGTLHCIRDCTGVGPAQQAARRPKAAWQGPGLVSRGLQYRRNISMQSGHAAASAVCCELLRPGCAAAGVGRRPLATSGCHANLGPAPPRLCAAGT